MDRRSATFAAPGRIAAVCLVVALGAWSCAPSPTVSSPPASSSVAPAGATSTPAARGAEPIDAGAIAGSISEAGLRSRADALADVSADPAGHRAVGTPGFDAAADLVADGLRDAGWEVTEDVFTTPAFLDQGGSELVVGGRSFEAGDILPLIFAPSGDVTGPVVAIDWDEDARAPTGRGCSAADYGELPEGAIVLVRSGPCYRRDQVIAAQEAGAAGFVAAYPATTSGRPLRPTLIEPAGLGIPAVSATRPAGNALAAAASAGGTARLVTHVTTADAETRSVIADLPGSQPEAVVMLGAHLDSVIDGPGINDNGSGVAALQEIAEALRGAKPRATIRLAFWGAEEVGLHGSSGYVGRLSAAEREAIVVYLNADMLASPNGFAGVYDDANAAPGSAAVRDLLRAAVDLAGGVPVNEDTGGGSDHQAFMRAGIATGGVIAGTGAPVTPEQAAASGATAGQPADPCYHAPCDDGSDLDLALARVLTSALTEVLVGLSNEAALPDQ